MLFLHFFLGVSLSWCVQPLHHGDTVVTPSRTLYVFDHDRLRKVSDGSLLRWYKVDLRLKCLMNRRFFAEYTLGDPILFRPDQDFVVPVLVRSPVNHSVYLWIAGVIRHVKIPLKRLKIKDRRIYVMSRLAFESLPRGRPIVRPIIRSFLSKRDIRRLPKLVRGSHSARFYLIKGGKRFYFWSREALFKRGLQPKNVKKLSNKVLYGVPFGGTLF